MNVLGDIWNLSVVLGDSDEASKAGLCLISSRFERVKRSERTEWRVVTEPLAVWFFVFEKVLLEEGRCFPEIV
jgi:hypothetical protein